MMHQWNVGSLEVIGRTDTGQQEELGRIECAAAHDRLTLDIETERTGLADRVDTDRAPVTCLDPRDPRPCYYSKVRPVRLRVEVCLCRTPANTSMDVPLRNVNALLLETVVIGAEVQTAFDTGLQECLEQWVLGGAGLDFHRAAATPIGVWALVERLRLLEVRQHVVIRPALGTQCFPVVVVPGIATHPIQ